MTCFQPGQTVYILWRYQAKVVECSPQTVTCDVVQGLAPHDTAPQRANYNLNLVEAKQRPSSPREPRINTYESN
jgi:hypothetical protein